MALDPQQTVASVVLEHSGSAHVFQKHRIDYCCRGDLSLAAAAKERGVELETLLGELAQAIAGRAGARGDDLRALSTKELVSHIVSTHHTYLRDVMPFVATLSSKVSRVHGSHNLKLRALEDAVHELTNALGPHLYEEEGVLFPALLSDAPPSGEVQRMLDAMVTEHHDVATLLERIEAASDGFTLPEWACTSYRALFGELQTVRDDIFRHVHLENHLLRPRFVASVSAS